MEEIKLDATIKSFCSDVDFRGRLLFPRSDKGKVIASNGHIMVVAPEKYFAEKYEQATRDNFVKWDAVIPEHDKNISLFAIDYLKLLNRIKELPKEQEICGECFGEGKVSDFEDNENECEDCKGTGKLNHVRIPDIMGIYDHESRYMATINFQNTIAYFNINYVEQIAILAKEVGENIRWVLLEDNKINILYIGDIMLLFMPILNDEKQWAGYIEQIYLLEPYKVLNPPIAMKEYLEERIAELRKYFDNPNFTEMKTVKSESVSFTFQDPFYVCITSAIAELMKALNHLNNIKEKE